MIPAVAFTSLVLSILLLVALRSRHHKRHSSFEHLIDSSGVVAQELDPKGAVLIRGELWLARSIDGSSIPAHTQVTVVGTEDHLLLVR
jgi:membrane-bound serine protease (ClpP class)